MSTIVTRTSKGARLTNAEMDANLNNLNTDKLEAATGLGGGTFGFRNKIINGDMRVDQRNSYGSPVTVNSTANSFAVDRWAGFSQITDGVFTLAQVIDGPATSCPYSLKATITTADAAIGITQDYGIRQAIEGNDLTDFKWGTSSAKSVTLSFWVKGSVVGNYTVSIWNADNTRFYAAAYSIGVANTWERKTITFPGDTGGTWTMSGTGQGLKLFFSLGAGTTYTGAASSAWSGTRIENITGSVNLISTLSATLYLTAVQLEVGSVATPFEFLPYQMQLALCMRYYFKQAATSVYRAPTATASGFIYFWVPWPVMMRTAPTTTTLGTVSYTNGSSGGITNMNVYGGEVYYSISAGTSIMQAALIVDGAEL